MKKVLGILSVFSLLAACNSGNSASESDVNYEELGGKIVAETQMALAGELKAALDRGGVDEAVSYCNLNAISITDSMGLLHNAEIKRVTDLPRNFMNEANDAERNVIAVWNTKMLEKVALKPVVFSNQETVDFYAPIVIKPLCLNCHGQVGKELSEENYETIVSKYPHDRATGYADGELRGAWHVTFKK